MSEAFQGIYEVDDGYVSKGRPKYFEIDADDLGDDMTNEELLDLYDESAQEAFQQSVTYYTKNGDEFIAWAREQLAARKEEEEHDDPRNQSPSQRLRVGRGQANGSREVYDLRHLLS